MEKAERPPEAKAVMFRLPLSLAEELRRRSFETGEPQQSIAIRALSRELGTTGSGQSRADVLRDAARELLAVAAELEGTKPAPRRAGGRVPVDRKHATGHRPESEDQS